jgi:hypothetical protein
LVAKVQTIEEAIAAMGADVREWQAEDITTSELAVLDERDEYPDDPYWETNRIEELVKSSRSNEDIGRMWEEADERWEMVIENTCPLVKYYHREFVERYDGNVTTTVYHMLTDDFGEIDAQI